MFVLGNRSTVPLLASELETYRYHPHLSALDYLVSQYDGDFWNANSYNLWLSALRDLNVDNHSLAANLSGLVSSRRFLRC